MRVPLKPMLPGLMDEWKSRGWSLVDLSGFRMEGEGGSGGSGSADGGEGGSGGAASDEGANDDDTFPANTPVAEMTDKQRAAYWKHQSRKHEQRATERKDYDDLKKKADAFDKLQQDSQSEQERAVATAKEEADTVARADERSKAAVKLVDAEMKAAAAGRIESERLKALLEPLDRTKFLSDTGDVDEEKVLAFIASVAPEKSTNKGGRPDLGQGRRPVEGAKPSVKSGAERYRERHPQKS